MTIMASQCLSSTLRKTTASFLTTPAAVSAPVTTCHLYVKRGGENLTEADDDEMDRVDLSPGLQLNSRLGCQAVIKGPGTYVVEIPAWNKNYVQEGKPLTAAQIAEKEAAEKSVKS